MESRGEVWVWAEQRNNQLMSVSLELLNKGAELSRELATGLTAVLIGDKVGKLTQELVDYGASKVYLIEDERLELYQSRVYARVIAELIKQHKPEIVLVGGTNIGMDLAPRVAAKVKTGLTAHCADVYIDEASDKAQLIAVVPGWGGSMMVKIACPEKRPQMVTVKPGVMDKPNKVEGRHGQIIKVEASITDADFKARTIEMVEEKASGIPLDEADIIVAGGWGLESVGSFELVEELAEVLGGAVGGTRPVVDKGWLPEERMIGSSGKTVSPNLFVSVGASGAMHFTTGFVKSKVILAIDKNPKAPIFEVCDLGIVGDLGKVGPCLVRELRAIMQ